MQESSDCLHAAVPPAVTLEKSHLAIPVMFRGQEEYTKIQAIERENISDKAWNFLTAPESCWPILTLHKAGRNYEEENYFFHPALEEDEDHGFIASMGRTIMCEVQERKTQSLQPVLNIGSLQQVKPSSFSHPNSWELTEWGWEAEVIAEDFHSKNRFSFGLSVDCC